MVERALQGAAIEQAASVRPSTRTRRRVRLRPEALAGYLFLLPAVALTVAFVIWPIAQSFRLSLYSWNGDGPQTFVGLQNFLKLAQDKAYTAAFGHNILFMAAYTILEVVIGFFLAAMLNTRIRGVVFFRTVYFMPVVVPTAVAALLWSMLLAPTVDPFSAFFRAVGLPFLAHSWLGDSNTALYAVVAITVWKNVGVSMIVYLAAMQDVPAELMEAASIDGAGTIRKYVSIVLPLLRPITAVLIALSIIYAMRTFDVVWALTGTQPRAALEMVSTLIVRIAFSFHQFGLASALAVVLFAVIFVLALLQTRFMEERE
ncbi:MAG: sugar ABC transporter permease [Chloroflexota bacterium]|nr:sugar ABC transporter permease [Chloroflexota bacterium]